MLSIHEALTLKLSSSAPEATRACVLLFWRSLFGKDGWILPLFFFCAFVDLDFASVLKNMHEKKKLGEYSTILTLPLISNAVQKRLWLFIVENNNKS